MSFAAGCCAGAITGVAAVLGALWWVERSRARA